MQTSINFLELSQELLNQGKYLRFRAQGYSMYPAIRDGEVILVKPTKAMEIRLGDVLFYRTANEKVVCHRLIKRYIQNDKMVFLTKGDSMPASEQVIHPEDVIGKIVVVERDGKKIILDSGRVRIKALLRARLSPQISFIRHMRPRIFFGRFLCRLGNFIKSLSVTVMRPDDLLEFSRQSYVKAKSVEIFSNKDCVDSGLTLDEIGLLEKASLKQGRLLLLGIGGGREAISFARMGFKVTGVDFIPEMIKRAKQNASQRGLNIEGLVQEISKLEVPVGSFDIVWLSAAMYSSILTRHRRIEMLKRIRRALRAGGYFLCQFYLAKKDTFSLKAEILRKVFAFLSLGNFWYEKGDILSSDMEFMHLFLSEDVLRSEFAEAGFKIIHIHLSERNMMGGAVLLNA